MADHPFRYGILASESAQNTFPPVEEAKRALSVHTLLHVNLGWLSGKAGKWMLQGAGSLPSGYVTVGDAPVVRIMETRAGKIGVVLFPEGRQPGRSPDAKTVEAVLDAGRSLVGKVRLVIGVSPWGYRGERDFLKKAEGVYGCILGGGEGVGFDFFLKETPKVLWIRPDTQGRAVNILELLQLPGIGDQPKWEQNKTFRAYLEFLDNKFPSDPAVQTLVGDPEP